MISVRQKTKLLEESLKQSYLTGSVPDYLETVRAVADKLKGRVLGQPFFTPRAAISGQKIQIDNLTANVQEIKTDLEIVGDEQSYLLEAEVLSRLSFDGDALALGKKIDRLTQELNLLGNNSRKFYYAETFHTGQNIDYQKTTALVDTSRSQVTLPPQIALDRYLTLSDVSGVLLSPGKSGKVISGSFQNLFTREANEIWQAQQDAGESFTVTLIFSGPRELSHLQLDPQGLCPLRVEGSGDDQNYTLLLTGSPARTTLYNFAPQTFTRLRFTFYAEVITLSQLLLFRSQPVAKSSLYTKALGYNASLETLRFNLQGENLAGVSSFWSLTGTGNWQSVVNGSIPLDQAASSSLYFTGQGAVTPFLLSPSGSGSLYSITGTLPLTVARPKGTLARGLGQFFCERFLYDWSHVGDSAHVAGPLDWLTIPALTTSCYMTPASGGVPSVFNFTNETPLQQSFSWAGSADYWGLGISEGAVSHLQPGGNYRFTTYLYSDRNILLPSGFGGLYAFGASSPGTSVTWSLNVNDNSILSGSTYQQAVAGAAPSQSNSLFNLSLAPGWNKVTLHVYMPPNALLTVGVNVALLFSPNIFNILPADWNTAPLLREYPIWADGKNLEIVSEFSLQYNTRVKSTNRWGWHLDTATNTVSGALLSYDPGVRMPLDNLSLGSYPTFLLTYPGATQNIRQFFLRLDLSQSGDAPSPMLSGYTVAAL